MQDMIYNPRGTRAFDRRGGRVLALAATALAAAALPAQALPTPRAKAVVRPLAHKATLKALGGPDDVTLDFVAADINDVLKALALQTHTNIVSGTDVKGTITVSLAHVSLEEALDMISKLSGYQYAKVGRTYVVGSPGLDRRR